MFDKNIDICKSKTPKLLANYHRRRLGASNKLFLYLLQYHEMSLRRKLEAIQTLQNITNMKINHGIFTVYQKQKIIFQEPHNITSS